MPKKGQYEDLTGKRFGKLTVICMEEYRNRRYYWKCECDCGQYTIVYSNKLKSGHTKSCGCIGLEKIKKLNYKNGMSCSKLYYAYKNMLNRCYRKNDDSYYLYGQRGITVCDEWTGENGFLNFSDWSIKNGYSEGLTIDRIDNLKGYSPDNCRWVDVFVQANNKRNNRYLTINGITDTISNHARRYNINYWNLLHYSKGGKNCKYPDLMIEEVK